MLTDFWKDKYPENIPYRIDTQAYSSVLEVFHEACHTAISTDSALTLPPIFSSTRT